MLVVSHTPLAHDGARYRPAFQPYYCELIVRDDIGARTNGRLTNADLDMLCGNGLVPSPYFLQSAPHGLRHRRCMVSRRNCSVVNGLIDSGGYQISTGKLRYSESRHYAMLRYAERFEAACILDAPTSAIGQSGFSTFEDCLRFTYRNGRYTIRNRKEGATHFLNVIQGRSLNEARTWLDAVKSLNDPRVHGSRALEGWAYAGATRTHFSIVLELLVRLRDENLLRPDAYLHFLGLGAPAIACVLTAIQDGLRETVGEGITVSFDNATPFLMAGEFQKALCSPVWPRKSLAVRQVRMPNGPEHVGSEEPWPCSSPIADRLTLGDLNVRKRDGRQCWDAVSGALVMAHNTWVLSAAIADANRSLRLGLGAALGRLPSHVVEIAELVREVLRSENPGRLITQHKRLLDSLSSKSRNTRLIDDPNGIDR